VEREQWVRLWLATGKGGIWDGQVCPWPCDFHLKVSIPQIDRFTDVAAIAEDWERHRESLLAEAEETGRPVWAARYFE
jgi:hypothetical protein